MKIERSSMVSVLFKDIKKGDVFIEDEGHICMKTEHLFTDSDDLTVNAVTLDSGDLFFIENDNFVWLPKSAKLIVEE